MAKLEKPKQDGGPGLWGVIKKRRSDRSLSGPISKRDLSQLLWAADGLTGGSEGYGFRSAPSAGALYPVETYVVANRIDGLDSGIYHYDADSHELELVKSGDFREEISEAALGQVMCSDAAVVFVWTIVFDRCARKYGERANRYVFLDAGHIAQNLLLAAEALGFGACPIAAFRDSAVNEVVGADGKMESAGYMAAVGRKA